MDEPSTTVRRTTAETLADRDADRLVLSVYDQLRALARRYLASESSYRTLQPTALVHEAYLRLLRLDRMEWTDGMHFFAVAATQMRRILVERARAASARKRGSRTPRIPIDLDSAPTQDHRALEMLALDEALRRLDERNARQARVAEMHVFAGMEMREIAAVLALSERTIKRDWRVARAWLARALREEIAS
jgi:RNA polymerase sigma factor (TIGR02999 family)